MVFGRKYGGIAYWAVNTNIANPTKNYFGISTKNNNIEVDWKDGTSKTTYNTTKNTDTTLSANNSINVTSLPPHSFPANFIANVELNCLGGLNDVYSLYFAGNGIVINQDFGSFINQFTSLYSINIDIPHSVAYLNGDVSQIPNSLEKFYIRDLRNSGNLYLNISNFNANSQLKEFKSIDGQYNHNGFTNIYGDLSKLPPLIKIFTLKDNLANTFTYTSGKVWASSFDTLDIGNATLSLTETDNLFNDMANSITAAIGSKVIRLANCYRTSASNTAVAYLQSLGFTITVMYIPAANSKILDLPLQNSFTDTTGINTMIAGGTSNLPTFTLEGGEYAANFNGSQSLKTNANFVIGTDKVSISFWMKTKQTVAAIIVELSANTNTNNAFSAYINDNVANSIQFNSRNTGINQSAQTGVNNGTWKHFVAVIDRAQNGANEILIYENGVLVSFTKQNSADNSGNFVNNILYIGQRAGNSAGFNGQMKFLKIFNYPLSTTEITNLYNKTM